MWNKIKKVGNWVKVNIKLVLILLAILFLVIFLLWLVSKNRKIKNLENQLMLLKAKFQMEKLSIKHNIAVEDLKSLTEKDEKLKKKLVKIEEKLNNKLKEDLSPEELAKKFKELGL
jgi:hypothetical protein